MPKRIFIGTLSVTTTDATINLLFSRYGTISRAAIQRDDSGESLRTAIVEYTTEQAGTDAIAALNQTVLDGSTISVS
jgi:polyadenylate-binding protein